MTRKKPVIQIGFHGSYPPRKSRAFPLSRIILRSLKQGAVLGKVGQSGSCFAPCLHYEVLRDGFAQDPVNYFFAELDPATYRDMMIVALTTGQSMD